MVTLLVIQAILSLLISAALLWISFETLRVRKAQAGMRAEAVLAHWPKVVETFEPVKSIFQKSLGFCMNLTKRS